jgi:hypothetical protein
MTQGLVAPLLDFGGTPSMCVVVSNREKPMDTTGSSFTARNNAKRAAEKMIANGKAPAVDYGIRPRDDGRFEIVWKTVPTTGEVETEIATAAAAEDGHYSTNPLLSVNEDPSYAPPNAGVEEAAAATGNEPAASSVPTSGAPERDNKWPDGTRVMVRNKPKSWSEATICTRLDAEYWRVQYPSGGTGMFKEGDLRAYDAERDAKRAGHPRRARATEPRMASRPRRLPTTEAASRPPRWWHQHSALCQASHKNRVASSRCMRWYGLAKRRQMYPSSRLCSRPTRPEKVICWPASRRVGVRKTTTRA